MNVLEALNQSNYDFYFLVVDEFLNIEVPEIVNFTSLSPEILGIKLVEKNSGRLLAHPTTQDFIHQNSAKTGHIPAIVPFKPSARVELICQQNHWLLVSNPASLNRFFEDKIKFAEICQKTNLPAIPHLISQLSPETYQQAQAKFGPKLVIQTHFGWAGNSTYFSESFADLKIEPNTIVKFSPLLEGYSLLNNCCLIQNSLLQSPPALQYTGLKPLTQNPFATVGRQWPSMASKFIIDQVKNITDQFGQMLKQYQYLGFFGLDFFVSENKVYLLECNPRLTASFAFYTDIEKNAHLNPLFYFHLAQFANLNFNFDPVLEQSRFSADLIGSEITLKDSHSTTTKKFHSFEAFSPTCDPIILNPKAISQVL